MEGVKYAPSILLGRLSRSAGSTTASHNRFGAYLRNRTIPTNPMTDPQTLVRDNLGALASAYRDLTEVQRTGWRDLGLEIVRLDSLGQQYTLTGIQAFIMANRNRFSTGLAQIDDAPAVPTIPTFIPGTLTLTDAPAMTIAFTPTPLGAGFSVLVFATPAVSAGKNFMPSTRYKLIMATALNVASPLALLTAYQAIFSDPLLDEKVFLKFKVLHEASGVTGPEVNVSQVVIADA
jgi:hypothetical protein